MTSTLKSWVSKFVTRSDDRAIAICNLCHEQIGYDYSLEAIANHLEKKHNKLPSDDSKQQTQRTSQKTNSLNLDDSNAGESSFESTPRKISKRNNNEREICSVQRQESITEALATLIATNSLPVSLVSSDGFKNFMKVLEPDYKVPSDKTVLRRLNDLGNNIAAKVTDELSKAFSINLSIDIHESYILVEAQFVDKNLNIRRVTLCSEYIGDRRNPDNIAAVVTNTIEQWNLINKVQAVVHYSIPMMNAARNIIEVPDSVKCSTHLLQLVVKDSFAVVSSYNEICTKGHAITMHFWKSNLLSDALVKQQIKQNLKTEKLKQSYGTRWDSKYYMCDFLLRNRVAITLVLADRKIINRDVAKRLTFSETDWDDMKKMVQLLRPFQAALTLLRSENIVTISMVRPIIYNIIEKHLVSSFNDDDDDARNFTRKAIDSLKKRFMIGEDEISDVKVVHIAQFFDPRYKSLSIENLEMKNKISNFILHLFSTNYFEDEDTDTRRGEQDQRTAIDFLFQEESTVTGWKHQYDLYLAEPELGRNLDPLEWWKNHSNKYLYIFKIAIRYLGIPATSATSEKTFLTARDIIISKRNCLNPQNVNLLTFLYQNRNLIG